MPIYKHPGYPAAIKASSKLEALAHVGAASLNGGKVTVLTMDQLEDHLVSSGVRPEKATIVAALKAEAKAEREQKKAEREQKKAEREQKKAASGTGKGKKGGKQAPIEE